MFLEDVEAAQDRTECGEQAKEVAGLPDRERRAARADAQREASHMGLDALGGSVAGSAIGWRGVGFVHRNVLEL